MSPDPNPSPDSRSTVKNPFATAKTPVRAAVLLSGGVDSATCLALAIERFGAAHVICLAAHYGQRHSRELESAFALADHYGVPLRMLQLSDVLSDSRNALMASSPMEMATGSYADQVSRQDDGPVSTYVPFRNGLMLSAAAACALSLDDERPCLLYLGAHADDAAGNVYPDCSQEFLSSMGDAISLGTYGLVSLETPFAGKSKADVVKCGLERGVPYELTWSCYEGAEKACGKCGTCVDRLEAFGKNGVDDPIEYA